MRHFLTSKQQKTMPDLPFSIVSFGKPFQTNEPPTEDNHALNLQRIHLQAMFWMSNPCGWHPSAHNFAMRRQITMYHVPLHIHSHILTHRATSKSQAPHPPTGPLPTSPPWCKTAEDKKRDCHPFCGSSSPKHPSLFIQDRLGNGYQRLLGSIFGRGFAPFHCCWLWAMMPKKGLLWF